MLALLDGLAPEAAAAAAAAGGEMAKLAEQLELAEGEEGEEVDPWAIELPPLPPLPTAALMPPPGAPPGAPANLIPGESLVAGAAGGGVAAGASEGQGPEEGAAPAADGDLEGAGAISGSLEFSVREEGSCPLSPLGGAGAREGPVRDPKRPVLPFPPGGEYEAVDNETVRSIAYRFGCNVARLVQLNKERVPGLWMNARLIGGTKLKLPQPGDASDFVPTEKLPHAPAGWAAYCHWTFPDQAVEDMLPSYMMVRRLERRERSRRDSQAFNLLKSRCTRMPPVLLSDKEVSELEAEEKEREKHEERRRREAAEREKAKGKRAVGLRRWPRDGVHVCKEDERPREVAAMYGVDGDRLVLINKGAYPGLHLMAQLKAQTRLRLPSGFLEMEGVMEWVDPCIRVLNNLKSHKFAWPFLEPVDWEELGIPDYPFMVPNRMDLSTLESKLLAGQIRSPETFARQVRLTFDNATTFNPSDDEVHQLARKMRSVFEGHWSTFKLEKTRKEIEADGSRKKRKHTHMFNRVVAIEDAPAEYYFVLHYVPDLQWCHLAPMRQEGLFPATTKQGLQHPAAGRPCWKLVPEGEGQELDVSAERCRVVRAATIKKCADADKEHWDLHDHGGDERDVEEGGAPASGAPASAAKSKDKGADKDGKAGSKGGKANASEGARGQEEPRRKSGTSAAAQGGPSAHRSADGQSPAQPKAAGPPLPAPDVWRAACLVAVKKMMRHPHAWPFNEPVDPEALGCPDYFEVVRRPMDFGTVRKRLEEGRYRNGPWEAVRDLRLTLSNALTYNPEEDKVHALAKGLTQDLDALLAANPILALAGAAPARPSRAHTALRPRAPRGALREAS